MLTKQPIPFRTILRLAIGRCKEAGRVAYLQGRYQLAGAYLRHERHLIIKLLVEEARV